MYRSHFIIPPNLPLKREGFPLLEKGDAGGFKEVRSISEPFYHFHAFWVMPSIMKTVVPFFLQFINHKFTRTL